MTRPRALDLFCGAGGAAMGLHRAGFDVVGIDHKPQKHYPFHNRIDNLELWVSRQPTGCRVAELLVFAKEIVRLYG